MTRLRTTGLRTTARLRTTTTVGSTIATEFPAEDIASALGATIDPAAFVSELAIANAAKRPADNSAMCVVLIIWFPIGWKDAARSYASEAVRRMNGGAAEAMHIQQSHGRLIGLARN